jgi:kynurenine formamidase
LQIQDLINSKCYDLGHSLDRETPIYPSHPPFYMTLGNRHGDIKGIFGDCGYGSANEVIVTSGHHSTHIDSLAHISDYGTLFGDIKAEDVQKGVGFQRGFTKHGVETIQPIIRRGVMLDIPVLKGRNCLEIAEPVTDKDLQDAIEAQKVQIEKGDCILIRTGWSQHWKDKQMYLGGNGGIPGPDMSAAKWLLKHNVFLAGSDTIAFELRSPEEPSLPVHQELIARNGVHLIECLNLEELSQDNVYEFLFIAIPLKITGATGSPIRPIALVK